MPICVGVTKERMPQERRVALVPEIAKRLSKLGAKIVMEKGAGQPATFLDDQYSEVQFVDSAEAVYQQANVVLTVNPPELDQLQQMQANTVLVGFMTPHRYPDRVQQMQSGNITSLAMELVPRISRAQSMDALSSQAAVAGYKAVIMAAHLAAVFFPMLTTAAGTIRPAKVLVIGAGVAGLQAIATARRLGAMVEGYDVRAATKEQVESLGAKFIDMPIKAEGEGGYARELTAEEKQQQQDILAKHIAAAHVVITTAAIPGKASPKIISQAMVEGMAAGSVVVDLAAEGGGNCEVSQPGKTINHQGIIVHAPLNVPSQTPLHASEMYARNLFNLLSPMIKEGELALDWDDEVLKSSCLTHAGEIKHAPTRELVAGAKS